MQPIFSIIIPAYNLSSIVCCAINSCLSQTGISHAEYEIIVINDGSTDNTTTYLEKYRNNPRIQIVDQQNSGLSGARNRGISLSSGQYILFLDGDDWLEKNALHILKQEIENDTLIIFPLNYVWPNGKESISQFNLIDKHHYTRNQLLKQTLGYSQFNIIPAQAKLYPASILKTSNINFIHGILHEDNPFFAEVCKGYTKFKFINEKIYNYRQQREGSITSAQSIRNFTGTIKGIKQIEQIFQNSNADINFLISNLFVFQAILKYNDGAEKYIFHYLRNGRIKLHLLKLLFSSRFRYKHFIRHCLLIIDPKLLRKVLHILYG